ncbi:C4b-binding protein alpha chain-like [Hyperolius riggenbachi]|uniref:C4b-binding protein alpha chain-like n=1 Tax=Hyperolius riggenbachi TaxID=752182 RepID=UPI0035A39189
MNWQTEVIINTLTHKFFVLARVYVDILSKGHWLEYKTFHLAFASGALHNEKQVWAHFQLLTASMERKCVTVMLRIVLLYTIISSVHCDCGPPPDIRNSRLKNEFQGQTTFPPGSSVKYECHPGYTTIPGVKNNVICLSNSRWSPSEEFCTLKRCPHPGDIENGFFEAVSFFFGSRVTYFCNEGYRMQSKKQYRDCLADGKWSYTQPLCEVAVCPPPPTIPGGSFNPQKDEYQYRDSVTYNCNDRNAVMEHDSVYCTENGNWSNTEPRCTVVDCPSPNVPNSKKLMGFYGQYGLNFMVEFECNKGFKMNGSKTIQCTIQSTWDPPPPKCIKLYCPEPKLENGTIISGNKTDGSYDIKDSVTLGCDQGFRLRGERKLTCGEDFQWKPEIPYCALGLHCSIPRIINGKISKGKKSDGSYSIGSKVTMECNSGYELNDNGKLTCGDDLKWSPGSTICQLKNGCKSPVIQNGRVTEKNGKAYNPEEDGYGFSGNDKISIACNEGYQLNGMHLAICSKEERSFTNWFPKPYWFPEIGGCERKRSGLFGLK